jgi:hypothetical protein
MLAQGSPGTSDGGMTELLDVNWDELERIVVVGL